MSKRWRVSTIGTAALVACCLCSWSDTVELTDGRTVEGLIQSVSPVEVTIKLDTGAIVRFPRSRVRTITRADWQYYMRKGDTATDPDRALEFYEKARELNPTAPGLSAKIRTAQQRADRQAKARTQQETESKRKTEDAQVLAEYQRLIDAARPEDVRREFLENTLREKPYLCRPRIKLADIYERDKTPEGQVRYVEVLAGLVTNDCEAYYPIYAPILVQAAENLLLAPAVSSAMSFSVKDRLLGVVAPFVDSEGRALSAEQYRKRKGLPEPIEALAPAAPAPAPGAPDSEAVAGAKSAARGLIEARSYTDLADNLTNESAAAVGVVMMVPAAMMAAFSNDEKVTGEFEKFTKPFGLDKKDALDDAAALARLKTQGRRFLSQVGTFLGRFMEGGDKFAFEYDGSRDVSRLKFTEISATRVRMEDPAIPAEKAREARLEEGKWRVHLGSFESILKEIESQGDAGKTARETPVETAALPAASGVEEVDLQSPVGVTLNKISFLKNVCLKRPTEEASVEPEMQALMTYKQALDTDEGRAGLQQQVNAWVGQSSLLLSRGDLNKAAALAEVVLVFRPESLSAQTIAAAARVREIRELREKGQFDRAAQRLGAAEKVLPDSPTLGAERARLYLALADRQRRRGDYANTIQYIHTAGSGRLQDPQMAEAVQNAEDQVYDSLMQEAQRRATGADFEASIGFVQLAAKAKAMDPFAAMKTRRVLGDYREELRKHLWIQAMQAATAARPDFKQIAEAKSKALQHELWFAPPKEGGSTTSLAQDVATVFKNLAAEADALDKKSDVLTLYMKIGGESEGLFPGFSNLPALAEKARAWVREGNLPIEFFHGVWTGPGVSLEIGSDFWRFSGAGASRAGSNLYSGSMRREHRPSGETSPIAYGLRVDLPEGQDNAVVWVLGPNELGLRSYSLPSPGAPDGRRVIPFQQTILKWNPLPQASREPAGDAGPRRPTSDTES